jgi:hypothetical protein
MRRSRTALLTTTIGRVPGRRQTTPRATRPCLTLETGTFPVAAVTLEATFPVPAAWRATLSPAQKSAGETGTLTNPLYEHVVSSQQNWGGVSAGGGFPPALGPSATCGGQLAWGAVACLRVVGCNLSITISATKNGVGGSITWSPTSTIWGPNYTYVNTCPAKESPGCIPGSPPAGDGADGYWTWNATDCTWDWTRLGSTPIVIDTDGSGFRLTSASGGVYFDFYGNGHPIQIAWTAPGSANGWLALVRPGTTITSGQQLFGNITPQPPSSDPNGFLALAVYDRPDQGGTGTGSSTPRMPFGLTFLFESMPTMMVSSSRRSCAHSTASGYIRSVSITPRPNTRASTGTYSVTRAASIRTRVAR